MSHKFTTTIYKTDDDDNEFEVTVNGKYDAGHNSYFDKSYGNYLPAEPPHLDVKSAIDQDGNNVDLSEEDEETVVESLIEDEESAEDAHADDKRDQMKDDKATGDYYDRWDDEE